jgi:hypothetical protein
MTTTTTARWTTARRAVAGVLVMTATTTVLAGCVLRGPDTAAPGRTEPTVDADTAKQQMIEAVDDATERLGGEWKARTGPDYPEDCELEDGTRGAQWRYLTGSTLEGSPDEDATRMEEHWKSQGMQVVRRESSDGPAVIGSGGGKIASISAYAYPGNYTVQAVSLCFPGNADDIAEDLSGE